MHAILIMHAIIYMCVCVCVCVCNYFGAATYS